MVKTRTHIYREHEKEKKSDHNERVLNIEKGTFNPIVFTTSGMMKHAIMERTNTYFML